MRSKASIIFFLFFVSNLLLYSLNVQLKAILEKFDQEQPAVLDFIAEVQNVIYPHPLKIIFGTNTGYGFYGTKVATQKYFFVELYSQDDELIQTIDRIGTRTMNSKIRFEVLASRVYNIKDDLMTLEKKNDIEDMDLKLRERYLDLLFQYGGKYMIEKASSKEDYDYFVVKLAAVIPRDAIKASERKKINVFIVDSRKYCSQD